MALRGPTHPLKKVSRVKKRGRPDGRAPQFAFRDDSGLIAEVDAFARAVGDISRSDAIRILLRVGLASKSAPPLALLGAA